MIPALSTIDWARLNSPSAAARSASQISVVKITNYISYTFFVSQSGNLESFDPTQKKKIHERKGIKEFGLMTHETEMDSVLH